MSAGTLYTVPEQVQGRRIQAVAAFGGVDIKLGEGYEHRVTNKTAEYLAKFPTGLIPALETPEGAFIAESEAIAKYVASLAPNSTLLSTDAVTNATIDQWINFSTQEIFIPAKAAKTLTLGNRGLPYNKPIDTGYRAVVLENLQKLENYLATRTYLVGERITLADIHVASQLKYVFESIVDAAARASLTNTVRFYNTIANHPKIAPSFGETAFAEKALQFTPPAKEKKEKPAKEAAPAAPKEKPAKAAAAEEEEEPLVPAEPKVKNPLDDLPKSAFNLEDWKRAYSNMDTKGAGGSLEWFYEKFDKEGFSLWRVDFKYNDELTQTFMSSNQIGGFFNRLEASRKYLFGSMGVLGETNNSIITGALILRGQDYKPVVDVAPDWESYSYAPISLDNADDKKFFEDALAWDLEIDGKKWADGKNFK